MTRVLILLPVHNRCEITKHFIDSLLSQTYENYHLILIDDGSTDGTAEMVGAKVPVDKLTIIKGSGNWWWAGSLQQGINWLRQHDVKSSDVILMINDDVTFEKEFLEQGVRFIERHQGTLLLARYHDVKTNRIVESGVKADWSCMSFQEATSPEEINCFSTRGLFLSFGALSKLGNFHPFLLPHYGSDYEYTMRAPKKGLEMRTIPELYLQANDKTTGIREGRGRNFLDEWRTMFSKRCAYNPVYWTTFILLSCPLRWVAPNLVRVWAGAAKRLGKSFTTWKEIA